MRIPCLFCGDRDVQEFVYRGDASRKRPESDEGFYEYVYLRENLAGVMSEHWYHAQGCRNWIEVARNTVTHEVSGSRMARSSTP